MTRPLCVLVALLAGCAQISGLDSLGVCDGAACVDATVDAPLDAPVADVGVDAPLDAGSPDVHDASTVDVTLAPCSKPADCPGPGAVCCDTLTTHGQSPNCTIEAGTIACTSGASCATSIPFTCGTEVVRLCKATTDCTESSYPKCCTVAKDGAPPLEFCMSSLVAQALGATCL